MPDAAAKGVCKVNGLPSGALVTVDVTAVQPQWVCQSGAGARCRSSPEGSPRLPEGHGSRHPRLSLCWQIKSPEALNAALLDEHKIRGDGVGSPWPAPPPDTRGSPAQGSRRTLQGPARKGRSCIAGSRRVCVGGSSAALAGRWWWCAECSQAGPRLAKGPRRFRRTGRAGLIAVPLTHLVQVCLL